MAYDCSFPNTSTLAEPGVTLTDGPGPLPWGPIGFTVTDPDGFKLTISNPG